MLKQDDRSQAAAGGPASPAGIRPLSRFCAEIGKTACTVWRWRNAGMLEVLNICGKLYVTDEAIARFKARAAAGEFAREPVMPVRGNGAGE